MHLTRFTDYGLRLLIYLALNRDELVSIGTVAEAYGISRHHLLKVERQLAQLGVLEAVRGKGGGVRLARDPREIRVGAIVRSIEPSFAIVECLAPEKDHCGLTATCCLKPALAVARDRFLEALDEYTLAMIAEPCEELRVRLGIEVAERL